MLHILVLIAFPLNERVISVAAIFRGGEIDAMMAFM